jgi:hypothetical protein
VTEQPTRLAGFDSELGVTLAAFDARFRAARTAAVPEALPPSSSPEGEDNEDLPELLADRLLRQQNDHFPSGAFNTPASPKTPAHSLEQVPGLNDGSLHKPAGADESSEGDICQPPCGPQGI